MRGLIIISLLPFIIGCGTSIESVSESQIPIGAIVQDYESLPGLQKITVKGGNKIVGEGDFLNKRHHGTWTVYDIETESVSQITTFYHGKKQGVEFLFDKGNLKSKAYYHNDLLEGEYIIYNNRKNVAERRNYSGGVLEGPLTKYYNNGILMEESNFKNGKYDGTARWYDQEGNLSIEYNYRNGQRVEEVP